MPTSASTPTAVENLPGSERLGKLLFLRLDPTLRHLLTVIQQHQEITIDNNNNNNHSNSNSNSDGLEREERILSLLKAEAELLKLLQEAVLDFQSKWIDEAEETTTAATTTTGTSSSSSDDSLVALHIKQMQLSASMVTLMDYISLPLLAILQRPTTTKTQAFAGDNSDLRKRLVRKSAEWKSIAAAARTFQTCVELIQNGSKNKHQATITITMPTSKTVVQWLMACSAALPPGNEIAQRVTTSLAEGGLDTRGEHSMEAVLDAIATLLTVFGETNNAASLFISDPVVAHTLDDGALFVAHLVDTCVSIVVAAQSQSQSQPQPHLSHYSVSTRLKALHTLNVLLQQVPDRSTWRDVFPGCFAALFRVLIVGLGGTAKQQQQQSTTTVLEACFNTFLQFLWLTLHDDNNDGSTLALTTTGENNNENNNNVTMMKLVDLKQKSSLSHQTQQQQQQQQQVSGDETININQSVSVNTNVQSGGAKTILGDSSDSSRKYHHNNNNNNNNIPTTGTASPDEAKNENDTKQQFLSEINSRLPGPLTALCKLLLVSPSSSMRQTAPSLYQLIMMDARSCWEPNVQEDLATMALECCLILSRDNNDSSVASCAKSVLWEYQKTTAFVKDMKSILIPRILSMIQELPALAQRQSEQELRNKLKLIAALLELSTTNNTTSTISTTESKHKHKQRGSGGGCKSLQSSMAAEDVSCGIRKALAELLDIDFDHSLEAAKVTPIELIERGTTIPNTQTTFDPRFVRLKFLTTAAEKEAIIMIHEFGKALGPKHTAVFVDSCIADLFNDCVNRVEGGNSLGGPSQMAWCHEWIGCLTLIREIVRGAFTFTSPKRRDKKRTKVLKSLSTSIVPIIVSSPLWDLPTCPRDLSSHEDYSDDLESSDKKGVNSVALKRQADTIMPVALRGNSAFLCYLLKIVGVIVELLGEDASSLIPTILCPVLEKAAAGSTPLVRQTARQVLDEMVTALGLSSLAALVSEKLDVIAGALLASLRLPGGRSAGQVDKAYNDAISVAYTMRFVLELAQGGSDKKSSSMEASSGHDRSNLSYVIEVVTALTERFDTHTSKSMHESKFTQAILEVYESMFRYLVHYYRSENIKAHDANSHASSRESSPWLDVLTSFRTLASGDGDSDGVGGGSVDDDLDKITSPREGFEAYRNEKDLSTEEPDMQAEEKTSMDSDCIVSSHEVNFVAMLLSRCSFFLSNSNLRLQVKSCVAMGQGFQFLAMVARLCKDPEDDKKSAIRRQVSNTWSAIFSRFRAMVTEILASRGTSLVVFRQHRMPASSREIDVSTQMVFLSRLLELVAIMAECSGDFMASRFRNDVFPTISKLLGSYVQDQPPSETRDDVSSYDNYGFIRNSIRQASEKHLIASVLQCFKGVWQVHACGRTLAGLIPTAGTLVLPFLGEDGVIGVACEAAIQQMVQIDCDALWRPLIHLSGCRFPPSQPWKQTQAETSSTLCHSGREFLPHGSSSALNRAHKLVLFTESLPEQPLT